MGAKEMTIFVDMDGVLADFDTHHESVFGFRSDKLLDNVDWHKVRDVKNFYLNIPPMPDLPVLWDFLRPYGPIVLTGVPYSVIEAPDNKRAWVRRHLGETVEMRACASKEKYCHCLPGDILIDDWEKYKHLWVQAGGIWITHINAPDTVRQLEVALEAK